MENYIIILIIFLTIKDIAIVYFREKIAYTLNILDLPNKRKIHTNPTPLIGGLCIFTTLVVLLIFQTFENIFFFKEYLIVSLVYLIFFLTGFADDRTHLSPKIRTIIILSSIILLLIFKKNFVITELNFFSTSKIITFNYISLVFTVFCIFALYNAFNFIDGVNGAATSIILFWITFLIIKNYNYLYIGFLVTFLIIFVFNLKGKLFLGNSGTSIISILFSTFFINDYNHGLILADEIMFVLFFPGLDMIRVTILRLLKNKKIYEADKTHFHHYLLKYTKKYVWLIILLLTILPLIILYVCVNILLTIFLFTTIYFILLKLIIKKTN